HIHVIGTFLAIGVGDVAMLLLGLALVLPKNLKIVTIFAGTISIAGLALVTSKIYFGIGYGGMERVAAYPQTIWLIVFGLYMSANHFMAIAPNKKSR
ncbi:MAG TPA: hypothetical protein VGR89_09425, partial [Puia sp.]|nr:hypothetical protein [Puia sp.]